MKMPKAKGRLATGMVAVTVFVAASITDTESAGEFADVDVAASGVTAMPWAPPPHEGYLSWADYERNQRLIADNASGKGMMVRGAVRKGEALLAGLLRCGHCGRRLLVSYNGTKGDIGRYHCDATRSNPAAAPCISFGALRVDQAVGGEIVRLLQPLGLTLAAIEKGEP